MDVKRLDAIAGEMVDIRHDLHKNPQTAYEETYAQELITAKLKEWGVPYQTGLGGGTGTVAILTGKGNQSGKSLGLRADIDALDIFEKNSVPYMSQTKGKMHACGHDGHTASMLGVVKYLAETRNFDGTVHVIFQPAEEVGTGAKDMIAEGLFDTYKCDQIFGYHNWPGLPVGKCGTRPGPIMAAVDTAIITISGKGGHGALPHMTADPLICGAQLVVALQSIVSRNIDPIDNAVISVTNFNAGTGADNVIADTAKLIITVRSFRASTRKVLERRIRELSDSIAKGMGCSSVVDYDFGPDPTVNAEDQTELALISARAVYGNDNVDGNITPWMGAEDFGTMLQHRPGNYILLGNGDADNPASPHNQGLHADTYDYNDKLLPFAVKYFVHLVETNLPLQA
jgi:amidohydrolase